MRRPAEIVVACALLILTFPLLVLAALALRCESPGPVFEREECVRGGRQLTLLKFRTTAFDPGYRRPIWARQTTVLGWFLHYTQIDTLPRLINVLRGEVGLIEDGVLFRD